MRIVFLMTIFNYDTPKYYIMIENDKMAREILSGLYKDEYINVQH